MNISVHHPISRYLCVLVDGQKVKSTHADERAGVVEVVAMRVDNPRVVASVNGEPVIYTIRGHVEFVPHERAGQLEHMLIECCRLMHDGGAIACLN